MTDGKPSGAAIRTANALLTDLADRAGMGDPYSLDPTTLGEWVQDWAKSIDAHVAALLAEREAEVARLITIIRSLEWLGNADTPGADNCCVFCMVYDGELHAAHCKIAHAIAEATGASPNIERSET